MKLSGGISVGAQPTNFDLQRVRVGGMPFGTPKMVNYEDLRSVGFGLEKVEINLHIWRRIFFQKGRIQSMHGSMPTIFVLVQNCV